MTEVENDIAALRQIQHLLLIREEDARVGSGQEGESLHQRVERLAEGLTDATHTLYRRLVAKNAIFLAPLAKGNCSGCGLKVPIARMQHVLAKDRLMTCEHCGRILYVPEVKATGVRLGEPDPKFLLSRFSTPKLMLANLKATTPGEAIAELAALMTREGVVADTEKVVAAAVQREGILTTAVGHSLAFPHMRGVEEGFLTFAAGISPTGIDWNGQLVNLVFFTVLPVIASPSYLKLISAIAASFEDDEKLPFVLAAPDGKTLWKELNKETRVAVKHAFA